jgi:hypothetical protein
MPLRHAREYVLRGRPNHPNHPNRPTCSRLPPVTDAAVSGPLPKKSLRKEKEMDDLVKFTKYMLLISITTCTFALAIVSVSSGYLVGAIHAFRENIPSDSFIEISPVDDTWFENYNEWHASNKAAFTQFFVTYRVAFSPFLLVPELLAYAFLLKADKTRPLPPRTIAAVVLGFAPFVYLVYFAFTLQLANNPAFKLVEIAYLAFHAVFSGKFMSHVTGCKFGWIVLIVLLRVVQFAIQTKITIPMFFTVTNPVLRVLIKSVLQSVIKSSGIELTWQIMSRNRKYFDPEYLFIPICSTLSLVIATTRMMQISTDSLLWGTTMEVVSCAFEVKNAVKFARGKTPLDSLKGDVAAIKSVFWCISRFATGGTVVKPITTDGVVDDALSSGSLSPDDEFKRAYLRDILTFSNVIDSTAIIAASAIFYTLPVSVEGKLVSNFTILQNTALMMVFELFINDLIFHMVTRRISNKVDVSKSWDKKRFFHIVLIGYVVVGQISYTVLRVPLDWYTIGGWEITPTIPQ